MLPRSAGKKTALCPERAQGLSLSAQSAPCDTTARQRSTGRPSPASATADAAPARAAASAAARASAAASAAARARAARSSSRRASSSRSRSPQQRSCSSESSLKVHEAQRRALERALLRRRSTSCSSTLSTHASTCW